MPLTEHARAVLAAPVFAVVATLRADGTVHQSVVWVGHDGTDLLFGIERGSHKERNLRRDPRISVLLHPADAPYTYLAVRGTASIEPVKLHDGLMDEMSRRYTGKSHAEFLGELLPAEEDLLVVRVAVEYLLDR
ncbi:PPOX class F420-dependent oxidoreductase [Streptomyces sp. BE303]|uniref:PPOX class F420-dependent oxidoreductase n=1 Tax=Streptomyces sp. BE303 TaxID=3002528 RepID=UPI002E7A8B1C|nr:PPOX class F420-dependent oxidoreductase [Streptomyces sp. BE303]MED7953459.1 PPOX class F420-dependent oxidoreductase [Streptomyces sp. BE303]